MTSKVTYLGDLRTCHYIYVQSGSEIVNPLDNNGKGETFRLPVIADALTELHMTVMGIKARDVDVV
jgi:hypothetical protein